MGVIYGKADDFLECCCEEALLSRLSGDLDPYTQDFNPANWELKSIFSWVLPYKYFSSLVPDICILINIFPVAYSVYFMPLSVWGFWGFWDWNYKWLICWIVMMILSVFPVNTIQFTRPPRSEQTRLPTQHRIIPDGFPYSYP